MAEMDSIKKVQIAEQKAKETIAKAQAESQTRIASAHKKAGEIVSAGENDAEELRKKMSSEMSSKLEDYKAAEAKRISALSAKISKIKIPNAEIGRIADEVVKDILS